MEMLPLGLAKRRSQDTLPIRNDPEGQYEIMQFETSFAHKTNAIETVVIAREPLGWKVDGYFVR